MNINRIVFSALLLISFGNVYAADDPCDSLPGNWSGTWTYMAGGQIHSYSVSASNIYGGDHVVMKVAGGGQNVSLLGTCSDGNIDVSGGPGIFEAPEVSKAPNDIVELSGFIIGNTISMKGTVEGYSLTVDLAKK